MKLYHVSKRHAGEIVLDMSRCIKDDLRFVYPLLVVTHSYEDFFATFNSQFMLNQSTKKEWSVCKIAAEAIFEWVRLRKYPNNPSRLLFSYFTDSLETAEVFNQKEREGQGAIFEFEGDAEKCYYYDMDVFDSAVKLLETGLTLCSFKRIFDIADIYWKAENNKNIEILYKGHPILKRIQ